MKPRQRVIFWKEVSVSHVILDVTAWKTGHFGGYGVLIGQMMKNLHLIRSAPTLL